MEAQHVVRIYEQMRQGACVRAGGGASVPGAAMSPGFRARERAKVGQIGFVRWRESQQTARTFGHSPGKPPA
eukprot:9133989-Pyramimonas_sp.AAC.1